MPKKKQAQHLGTQQKKLATLIHRWAYTDPIKEPKKADRLFRKIWEFRFGQGR